MERQMKGPEIATPAPTQGGGGGGGQCETVRFGKQQLLSCCLNICIMEDWRLM